MEWQTTIGLSGTDGTQQTHQVTRGGCPAPHSPLDPLGLTLDGGKTMLAGVRGAWFRAESRSTARYAAARTPGASAR